LFLRQKEGSRDAKKDGDVSARVTRRVANGVALVSRNNSSRFSRGRGGKSERGDAREHGVEVLARLRVRGEVAEDDLEQVILRGAAAVARSGRGQHATNAGGANADVVVKRKE
jgi:hypothetical protein